MKVSLITLGCPKNLVDSEEMLGVLKDAGCEIQADVDGADVVVVNTCGFIESAKEESIEAILEAVRLKAEGACRRVVVTGCLAQRYAAELAEEMPEVDVFVGVGQTNNLPFLIEQAASGERIVAQNEPDCKWVESPARIRSTPPWTAYLKISDGCNNRCSYCAIPDIRGKFRSRPADYVLAEARRLGESGVKEICLVGQDITFYGSDLGDGWSLERLLREMVRIDGIEWIRLMYCYPSRITNELIDLVAAEPKIVKYMDIPFQHGDDGVLKSMNRRGTREQYLGLVRKLREACPEIALRTSFIVGFPGETRQAFDNLLGFVEEIRFDRVGAFVYSCEEGTPAADLTPKVTPATSRRRFNRLMELQQRISLERNREMLGRVIDVLIEDLADEATGTGRCYRDAPEIDGIVTVRGTGLEKGKFYKAKITGADEYDLEAEIVG